MQFTRVIDWEFTDMAMITINMSICPRKMEYCTDEVRRIKGVSNGEIVYTENYFCEPCIKDMKEKLVPLGVPEWVFGTSIEELVKRRKV